MRKDARTMNPILMAIPVLAIGLQDSASATISPAIAKICTSFPDVSTATIQLMVTLPALMTCVVAPFYGWMTSRIQPRKMIIFGLCCFIVGGMLPAVLNNISLILACRLLLGIGAGITLPACDSIIPQLYSGQLRENMMGWNMTVGAIGCMMMLSIGGILADVNWHLSFVGYGVGIITLLLVVFLLPEIPMETGVLSASETKNLFKFIDKRAYWELFGYFIWISVSTIITSNASLFIEGEGLGTAANSGFSLTLHLAGAALGALCYGGVKKLLKYYVIPYAWLISGAGFLLGFTSKSLAMVYFSMFFAGIGVGTIWPAYCIRMSELSKPVSVALIISIAGSIQGLGTFINPYVYALLVKLFGFSYGRKSYLVVGSVIVVGAAIVTIEHLFAYSKKPT